jgi:hypothetical protein
LPSTIQADVPPDRLSSLAPGRANANRRTSPQEATSRDYVTVTESAFSRSYDESDQS